MTLLEQLFVLYLLWAVWLWIVFKPRRKSSASKGVELLNKRIQHIRNKCDVE